MSFPATTTHRNYWLVTAFGVATVFGVAAIRPSSSSSSSSSKQRESGIPSEGTRASRDDDDQWAVEEVLRLWFDGDITENYHKKWFAPAKSEQQGAIDRHVKERFSDVLRKAEEGGLSLWKETPKGYLALIVLLDQLGR